MNSHPREVAGAQLLDRAVAILQAVREAGSSGVSLTTLITQLRLTQSTGHRILSSMEAHGLVERDRRTKRYRIGATIVALAGEAVDLSALQEATRPALARLSAVTGQTSYFALPIGLNTICIESRTATDKALAGWPSPGGLRPMGIDAAGQALLAFMPTEQAELLLKSNSRLFGGAGSPTEERVRSQIDGGRRNHYVLDQETNVRGEAEIATPILGQNGFAIGVLGIVVPTKRLSRDGIDIITSLLIDEARLVSGRLDQSSRVVSNNCRKE